MCMDGFLKGCAVFLLGLSIGPLALGEVIEESTVRGIYTYYKREVYPQVRDESKDTVFQGISPAVAFVNWLNPENFKVLPTAVIREEKKIGLKDNDILETKYVIIRDGYAVGGISKRLATDEERAILFSTLKKAIRSPIQVKSKPTPHAEVVERAKEIFEKNPSILNIRQRSTIFDISEHLVSFTKTDLRPVMTRTALRSVTDVLDILVERTGNVGNPFAYPGGTLVQPGIKLNVQLYNLLLVPNLSNAKKILVQQVKKYQGDIQEKSSVVFEHPRAWLLQKKGEDSFTADFVKKSVTTGYVADLIDDTAFIEFIVPVLMQLDKRFVLKLNRTKVTPKIFTCLKRLSKLTPLAYIGFEQVQAIDDEHIGLLVSELNTNTKSKQFPQWERHGRSGVKKKL